MKKIFLLPIIIGAQLLFSCDSKKSDGAGDKKDSTNTKKEEAAKAAPSIPLTEVDLSSQGVNCLISVPDSIKDKLVVEKLSEATFVVRSGDPMKVKTFELHVSLLKDETEEYAKTFIADNKSNLKGLTMNKVKRYLLDEPKNLVIQSEGLTSAPEYHFYSVVDANPGYFLINDASLMHFYNENEINAMVASGKSLKVKK